MKLTLYTLCQKFLKICGKAILKKWFDKKQKHQINGETQNKKNDDRNASS